MSLKSSEASVSGTDVCWEGPLRNAFQAYRRHASQSGQQFVMTFEEVPAFWSASDQEKVRRWQRESLVLWQAMVWQMTCTIALGAPFDEVDALMCEELKLRDSDGSDSATRLRLCQEVLRGVSELAAGRRKAETPSTMAQETRDEAKNIVAEVERKPWQRPPKERA